MCTPESRAVSRLLQFADDALHASILPVPGPASTRSGDSSHDPPLGAAYTVWTGIGAVGAFVVGIVALGEPRHLTRAVAAALIVGGIVLMKLSTP